eukprot:1486674-Rhodomonas_salina.2
MWTLFSDAVVDSDKRVHIVSPTDWWGWRISKPEATPDSVVLMLNGTFAGDCDFWQASETST